MKQLNLMENKNGNDQKLSDTNGRYPSNQNVTRARYQSFGNVQQNISNPQQSLQGYQNFQQGYQQANQQGFQQGNQQSNQQRTVKISLFPCLLDVSMQSLGAPWLVVTTSKQWYLK